MRLEYVSSLTVSVFKAQESRGLWFIKRDYVTKLLQRYAELRNLVGLMHYLYMDCSQRIVPSFQTI